MDCKFNDIHKFTTNSIIQLSLLQFPFILTVSRARKMRLAFTNEELLVPKRHRPEISQVIIIHFKLNKGNLNKGHL